MERITRLKHFLHKHKLLVAYVVVMALYLAGKVLQFELIRHGEEVLTTSLIEVSIASFIEK